MRRTSARSRLAPIAPLLLLLLPALLLPAGCNSSTDPGGQKGFFGTLASGFSTRRFHDEPIPIAVAGPVGVDVESFGGDVTVIANPKLTSATVSVTRRAVHGSGRKDVADAALAEIAYTAKIVPGELGPTLEFRATTTNPEPHNLRADVTIELPEVHGLRVHTANGRIDARDMQGKIDVVNEGGYVRVVTPWALRDAVTIINNSGDIDFRIRGESTGRLDFHALRGAVIPTVRYGELIVHTGTSHDTLRASFNGGDNPMVLRAADGEIRFAVVASPGEASRWIVENP